MRAEDIKVGHFYRFMGSNAVYAITAEWPVCEPREVAYFVIGPDGLIGQVETRRTAEELATCCSCEAKVRFDWVDQPKAAVGFMEGLLG